MASAPVRTRPVPVATRHFRSLDGCRGIAAVAVLVTHVAFLTATNERRIVGPYLARLDVGVAIFFVLSGFLLYRPMVLRRLEGRPLTGLRSYARRRFLRIVPAYWVVLTVAILLLPAGQKPGLLDLVRYYSLTHIYWPSTVFGPVDQAWSLGTEIAFYAFLPLYAMAMVRWSSRERTDVVRSELVGLGVLFVVAQLFRLAVVVPAATLTQRSLVTWLPNDLDWFALGMLLAVLRARCEWRDERAPLGLDRQRAAAACWVLAAIAFWLVSTHVGLPAMKIDFAGPQLFWRQWLYGIVAVAIVAPLVFGDVRDGIIRPLLASRPLRALGLISYGIYLWHQLLKDRYISWTGTRIFAGGFAPMLCWVLALTLVFATASWFLVERPALGLRDKPTPLRDPAPKAG